MTNGSEDALRGSASPSPAGALDEKTERFLWQSFWCHKNPSGSEEA